MAKRWFDVAEIRFEGMRFDEHALDVKALRELTNFIDIVANIAKEVWRNSHPDKKQLPAHFKEERVRLSLRSIKPGSAIAPLQICVDAEPGTLEYEEPLEAQESVELIYDTYAAVEKGITLPTKLPKSLIGAISSWGTSLSEDEHLHLSAPGRPRSLSITPKLRESLKSFADSSYNDTVEIVGEILEADVRQHRFQLWRDGQTKILVEFKSEQEGRVTSALHEHLSMRVRVRGKGRHSPAGKLEAIHDVQEITTLPVDGEQ